MESSVLRVIGLTHRNTSLASVGSEDVIRGVSRAMIRYSHPDAYAHASNAPTLSHSAIFNFARVMSCISRAFPYFGKLSAQIKNAESSAFLICPGIAEGKAWTYPGGAWTAETSAFSSHSRSTTACLTPNLASWVPQESSLSFRAGPRAVGLW
jgi:hypothetical protein